MTIMRRVAIAVHIGIILTLLLRIRASMPSWSVVWDSYGWHWEIVPACGWYDT